MVKELTITDQVLSWDLFWMLGIAVIIFPMMFFGRKFNRIDGVLLLGIYVTYVVLLIT
jgi:cation:H+ antiporter